MHIVRRSLVLCWLSARMHFTNDRLIKLQWDRVPLQNAKRQTSSADNHYYYCWKAPKRRKKRHNKNVEKIEIHSAGIAKETSHRAHKVRWRWSLVSCVLLRLIRPFFSLSFSLSPTSFFVHSFIISFGGFCFLFFCFVVYAQYAVQSTKVSACPALHVWIFQYLNVRRIYGVCRSLFTQFHNHNQYLLCKVGTRVPSHRHIVIFQPFLQLMPSAYTYVQYMCRSLRTKSEPDCRQRHCESEIVK